MEQPKLINNITERVVDDLRQRLSAQSRVSIAAASFSIYAYEALKTELEKIDELRFIFTSPTFIKDKAKKKKREFYIPKLNRERNLYGTDFEIRLRNQLSQKAIAKECAEWIRRKVKFRSNFSQEQMGGFLHVQGQDTSHVYLPFNEFTTTQIGFERSNGLDLEHINWGNYDLIVIDESHNFRNGGKVDEESEIIENEINNISVKYQLKKIYKQL